MPALCPGVCLQGTPQQDYLLHCHKLHKLRKKQMASHLIFHTLAFSTTAMRVPLSSSTSPSASSTSSNIFSHAARGWRSYIRAPCSRGGQLRDWANLGKPVLNMLTRGLSLRYGLRLIDVVQYSQVALPETCRLCMSK